ncbi:MAG TPA: hypothetical protein VG454_07765, partial [Gemmatimonadales bacterium]|nr:hypothetical protein [Gemmatimonadales bacterium]
MRYPVPVVVLLALIPDVAQAQSGDSLSHLPLNNTVAQMEAIARLKPSNTVRLHVLGQGWLSGSVLRNEGDHLVLNSDDQERVVPTTAIDSALVRHGHAQLGAGLGSLVGLIVGASAQCKEPPATSLGQAAAEVGAQMDCGFRNLATGLLVGAVVGAVLG